MAKKKPAKKAAAASPGKARSAKAAPVKSVKPAKKAALAPKKAVKPAPKVAKAPPPKAKKAAVKKTSAVKKAGPAAKAPPAKKTSPKKAAAKPAAKKAVKPAAKKAPHPKAKKAAPKPAPKITKPAPKAVKPAPAPAKTAVKNAPEPAPKAAPAAPVAKPVPTPKLAKAEAPAAPAPKEELKPAPAVAPAKAAAPSPVIAPRPVFVERPRSILGVAALPPGGMPEWWRWHQDYPGEETLRRGTVLTSFNLYAGLYTDTLRIHMAAGQSGIRAVSYSSKFSIDGDGSGGKQKGDADFMDNTSLHLNDGNPPSKKNALNSLTYPFAVLPLPPKSGNTLHFHSLGLDVGDIGIAFFGRGQAAPFIYGDEGPALQVGEGSVQMAKDLGMDWEPRMNTTPATGGFNEKEMRDYAPGVLHIAFPGSRDRPDRITDILTREALQTKAWELFKRWKQSLRGGAL